MSFFQKPSAANQGLVSGDATSGGGGSRLTAKEGNAKGDASVRSVERSVSRSVDEVIGVDTPPEKVPRRVLPSGFKTAESAGGASSLFSSIMHKFVKVDDNRDCSAERYYFRYS